MRKILLLIVLVNLNLFSQENIKYEKLISLSESLAYNFEFDSAKSVIYSAIKLDFNRPEAFLNLAKIHLWFYLGSKEEEDYNLFFQYSDSALAKAEILNDTIEDDPKVLYLIGNVHKYNAMAFGTKGNTLDAFWSTKKAVSYFEDVIEIDSTFYAAYGGIGIFEYALSYVPAFFNWALTISGLSADQKNGFELLELAVNKGKIDNTEYRFHLAKLYDEHLANYDKSLNELNSSLKKYPNNSLFHYQKAIEYIKSHELEKAIDQLAFVQEINHPKFNQTNSFSDFLLGDINFRLENYETALSYYLKFLTSTKTIDYTGIASFRAAFCYNFLENEQEFRRYLLLSSNGNLDLEDDKFARDESLTLIENDYISEYKALLNVENKYLSGRYSDCIDFADSTLDSLQWLEVKSQILGYVGLINLHKGELELLKNITVRIDSLSDEIDNWTIPINHYFKANLSISENNKELAEDYIADAESDNEFEKKNLIQSYINRFKYNLTKLK